MVARSGKAKKVLVTGGAGFIGSHLCDLLVSEGFEVTCVDNLLTGKKENIEYLLQEANFRFVKHDIITGFGNEELMAYKPDFIFHLASPASPIDYWKYPQETLLVNSTGVLHVLDLAKLAGAKVLITSTSEVYGDPLEHPQKETYLGNVNTFGPRSCYDESKRFSEAATRVFIDKYALDARIIRIFNTYGPRMQKDDGRVVSNFIVWALAGKDIKIDGDGSQTRSFCFVSDMVKGIYQAMFSEKTAGKIFNLGNPGEFTILELAKKVLTETNSKSKIVFSGAFRTDDPMRRCPDITKAREVLSWEPKVSLTGGLPKTIAYYKQVDQRLR